MRWVGVEAEAEAGDGGLHRGDGGEGPGTTQAAAAASAVHSERHRGGVHGLQLPPLRLQFTADLEARIEKVIYACRFMTFLAIAGSLIGSVPCFLKVDFYLLSSGSIYS